VKKRKLLQKNSTLDEMAAIVKMAKEEYNKKKNKRQ
jgi:hypothetical protein